MEWTEATIRSGDAGGQPAEGEDRGRVPVAVGLGSNLGRRAAHLSRAVTGLARLLAGLRCSRVYETRPVGPPDQPDFLNMCCAGETELSPRRLLRRLLRMEREAGRRRPETEASAPRVLDLDLLLYGDRAVDAPGLSVPHPEMDRRAFVLVPLAEVAPEWRHPTSGRTVLEMARRIGGEGVEPYRGRLPRALRQRIEGGRPAGDG